MAKKKIRSRKKPRMSRKKPRMSRKKPIRSRKKPRMSRKKPIRSRKKPIRSRKKPRMSRKKPKRSRKKPRMSRKKPKRSRKKPKRSRKKPKRSRKKPKRSRKKPKRKLKFQNNINTTNIDLNFLVSNDSYPLLAPNGDVQNLDRGFGGGYYPRIPEVLQYQGDFQTNNHPNFYPANRNGNQIRNDTNQTYLQNIINTNNLDHVINGDTIIVRYLNINNNHRVSILLKIMPFGNDFPLTTAELNSVNYINNNPQISRDCGGYLLRARVPIYTVWNNIPNSWNWEKVDNDNTHTNSQVSLVVMEEVDGNLNKLINKGIFNPNNINEQFSQQKALLNVLRVSLSITRSIYCLYNKQLYYTDLKPDNVFIKCRENHHEPNQQLVGDCQKGWRQIPNALGNRTNEIMDPALGYTFLLGDLGSININRINRFVYDHSNCGNRPPEVRNNNDNYVFSHQQMQPILIYYLGCIINKLKNNIQFNNMFHNNSTANQQILQINSFLNNLTNNDPTRRVEGFTSTLTSTLRHVIIALQIYISYLVNIIKRPNSVLTLSDINQLTLYQRDAYQQSSNYNQINNNCLIGD